MMTEWLSSLPAFRALRHRNYRLYFFGQAISILGTWVQQVALSWLVYRLTGSASLLGLTAFLAQAPQLVLGPMAGPWLDRYPRQKLLILTQALLMMQAILLGLLTLSGYAEPWHLVLLAGVMGVFTSIDVPLRQSLLSQLVVDKADVPNAIALNAAVFNSARFIGPPVAGILLTLTSETWCFFINALSFLVLILLAWRMHLPDPATNSRSFGRALQEGFSYLKQDKKAQVLLTVVGLLNITASAYVVLMPAFAREIYHGDARTLGWLLGAAGAGALTSSIWLASRTDQRNTLTIILAGVGMTATALLTFSLIKPLAIALPAIAIVGFGIALTNVASNSLIQLEVPDQIRGRVLSIYTAIRFGFDALGGLVAGLVASHLGVDHTLTLNAVILCIVTIGYWRYWRSTR